MFLDSRRGYVVETRDKEFWRGRYSDIPFICSEVVRDLKLVRDEYYLVTMGEFLRDNSY